MNPLPEHPCTRAERTAQLLRRWHKPLLALLLLLAYVPLQALFTKLMAQNVPLADAAGTSARVSAQWVGLWGPLSKLLWAVIFFYASGFFSFTSLKVAPVLTDWAKGHYSSPEVLPRPVLDYKAAFLALTDVERLIRYQSAEWKEMIRFSICLLAACLVV